MSLTIFSLTCLINLPWELFLVASDWKTTRKTVMRWSMRLGQYFCVEEYLSTHIKWFESTGTESAGLWDNTTNLWKLTNKLCFMPSSRLSTQMLVCEDKQVYKMYWARVFLWESKNPRSYHPSFYLGSIRLKTKGWANVSYALSNFRWQILPTVHAGRQTNKWGPALQAIIIHCGAKSVRIAPIRIMTDSYTGFLLKD